MKRVRLVNGIDSSKDRMEKGRVLGTRDGTHGYTQNARHSWYEIIGSGSSRAPRM